MRKSDLSKERADPVINLFVCFFLFLFFYLFKRAFLSFFVPPSFGKKRDLSFDA